MKNVIFSHLKFLKASNGKFLLAILGTFSVLGAAAQTNEQLQTANTLSLFSNPLFVVLLAIIVLLIIVITVLAGVLKSVAEIAVKKTKGKGMMGIILFLTLLSSAQSANAQASDLAALASYTDFSNQVLFFLLLIIGFEVMIILVLLNSIKIFTRKEQEATLKPEPSFFEIINASVAIEKEEEIMLDHNYDGIRELDNDLPPWWKYGFYFTIVVAIVYFVNYHVIDGGFLQKEEYSASIYMAKLAKEDYQKMNANNVNESSVTLLTDKNEIAKGETIFKENCFACHGKLGEGGVGPNLTDDYWLHGGSIKDVFVSIKYGWPDKGMKSWQADFSPVQIHEIASYIKTLKGSNPPNPKVPQGELYQELKNVSDSLKTDSTTTLPKTENLKIAIK